MAENLLQKISDFSFPFNEENQRGVKIYFLNDEELNLAKKIFEIKKDKSNFFKLIIADINNNTLLKDNEEKLLAINLIKKIK